MKIRNGFVSNSSSSSFIIVNKTGGDLTIVDFIKENPQIIDEFLMDYTWYQDHYSYTQKGLLKSAEENQNDDIPANSEDEYWFGDEDGTVIGNVFDYALRDGGESESFKWWFHESHR